MGIITLSGNVLHLLKVYPKKGLEEVSQPEPNTANDSSTEYKGKSKDDFQMVEKSNTDERYNFTRTKKWFLLMTSEYYKLMENRLLMFCIIACSFICAIQFLFFIIYWTNIVPRKTQRAITNLNYDYLTAHLKEQCVPYAKILDQCIL
ncbi:ANL_collapsed_G0017910.mRNA.1.CDS.1 [Saccharomyces cerevisiae]|nr:BEM_HP_G0118230.mRNA.1.CDS.1 [Saccharomyces cerevisiae]CAI4913841.1 AVN_HP_G0131020.mRNA.1.CDS.1 [Saccharomyces cerevisiae]CAI4961136.1 AVN_HP_G0013630.mRNA.1.CDS.1 [Saccharomyces cerevisiae]CAI4990570.1 ANL_HP_G0047160.mRNA.1.CDS.1 [Saccharomyces cerevisiae]CAI5006683.1 AVN_HP_G0049100.mRNA.1.CDS.1 [Saccharomyces cerevisiae]